MIATFFENQKKSYGDETTEFHDKENPKVGSSNHTCLAGISLDSALKIDENFDWVQIHWEKKVVWHITEDIRRFS